MSSDELDAIRRIKDLEAPPIPDELVRAVRDGASQPQITRQRRMRSRLLIAGSVVAALLVASFTPPGRAATGWVSDLAGLGDEPSLEQVGSVQGSAVVVDSGVLPDGTRYEAVVKRINMDSFLNAVTESPAERERLQGRDVALPEAVCVQIDWIDVQDKGQGGVCTGGGGADPPLSQESVFVQTRPGSSDALPGVLFGFVLDSKVESIRLELEGPSPTELPVRVVDIQDRVRERLGVDYPAKVFVAVLDGATIEAGEAGEAQVIVLAYDRRGEELGRVRAFTPPYGCDDIEFQEPLPSPPAGTPRPRPAERNQIGRVSEECPLSGGPTTSPSTHQLNGRPLPDDVQDAAASLGYSVEPALDADYPPLYEPSSPSSTVDRAAQRLAQRTISELIPEDVETGGVIGSTQIYLARSTDDDRLVYIGVYEPRGFTGRRPPDPRDFGLPTRFVGVFDVSSGEQLLLEQAPGDQGVP